MTAETVRSKSADLSPDLSTGDLAPLAFSPATENDVDRLVALKVLVMRGELERLGRYTPERARDKFVARFSPQRTRLIELGGRFAGCVTFTDHGEHVEIEHLYLAPECHGSGLGSRIMGVLMDEARALGKPVRLTVLNGSPANRFYQRLGFVETERDPIDIQYIWAP